MFGINFYMLRRVFRRQLAFILVTAVFFFWMSFALASASDSLLYSWNEEEQHEFYQLRRFVTDTEQGPSVGEFLSSYKAFLAEPGAHAFLALDDNFMLLGDSSGLRAPLAVGATSIFATSSRDLEAARRCLGFEAAGVILSPAALRRIFSYVNHTVPEQDTEGREQRVPCLIVSSDLGLLDQVPVDTLNFLDGVLVDLRYPETMRRAEAILSQGRFTLRGKIPPAGGERSFILWIFYPLELMLLLSYALLLYEIYRAFYSRQQRFFGVHYLFGAYPLLNQVQAALVYALPILASFLAHHLLRKNLDVSRREWLLLALVHLGFLLLSLLLTGLGMRGKNRYACARISV